MATCTVPAVITTNESFELRVSSYGQPPETRN